MSKKTLLAFGAVAVAALALMGSDLQARGKGKLMVRVVVDAPPDFSPPGTRGGSAFYIAGTICKEKTVGGDCTPKGVFHCWGWQTNPGMSDNVVVVSQDFVFDRGGSISVQGVEGFNDGFVPRSVVGGTGRFRNVRGEMTDAQLTFPEFVATFRLIGARGHRDDDSSD